MAAFFTYEKTKRELMTSARQDADFIMSYSEPLFFVSAMMGNIFCYALHIMEMPFSLLRNGIIFTGFDRMCKHLDMAEIKQHTPVEWVKVFVEANEAVPERILNWKYDHRWCFNSSAGVPSQHHWCGSVLGRWLAISEIDNMNFLTIFFRMDYVEFLFDYDQLHTQSLNYVAELYDDHLRKRISDDVFLHGLDERYSPVLKKATREEKDTEAKLQQQYYDRFEKQYESADNKTQKRN